MLDKIPFPKATTHPASPPSIQQAVLLCLTLSSDWLKSKCWVPTQIFPCQVSSFGAGAASHHQP